MDSDEEWEEEEPGESLSHSEGVNFIYSNNISINDVSLFSASLSTH